MVKIRLRRSGNKHRPFYRVVVAKSSAGRDGSFIEIIGTYNPVAQPKQVSIKEERALHWLMTGAQPTETAAVLLDRAGILGKFLQERPAAKKKYAFLDKRTAAMSKQSVVSAPPVEKAEVKAEEPAPPAADEVVEIVENAEPVEVEAEAPAEVVAEAEAAPEAAEEPAATEEKTEE